MSYYLKTEDVDRMEFAQERGPVVFRWLILLTGGVALFAGPALNYFEFYRGIDMPVMIVGFGILLIAAGALLRIQTRSLPAALILDNRRGILEILENDGRVFGLGYGDIERVGLRMRGRGRVIVALIRKNGAYWDLFRTNRRSIASEMGTRVQTFIEQGRRKERTYPAPPDPLFTVSSGPAAIYWKDQLIAGASSWIFLLLAGLAILVAGGLLRADLSLAIAAGAPAILMSVFALYLIYGLWLDKRGVRFDATELSYGFTRRGDWVSQKSVALDQIAGVLYSFDMYGGIPEILLPDADLYPRVTGLEGETQAPTQGRLARIKADLRAGLRVFRLSLSGLSVGDALALEFWLEGTLRDHRT